MTMHDELSHDEAIELLPWLVNNSLDADERETVAAHASACVTCRRELAELKVLHSSAQEAAAHGVAPEPDMRRINARIDAQIERDNRTARLLEALRDFFQSPWRVAFAVQTIVLFAVAFLWLQPQTAEPEFRTLTTVQTLPDGHYLRVVFDPNLDSVVLTELIDSGNLAIAAGPSERGVYTLSFAEAASAEERERIAALLLEDTRVLFAQQVVGGE